MRAALTLHDGIRGRHDDKFRHTPYFTALRGQVWEQTQKLQMRQGLVAGSLGLLAHPAYDASNHGSAIDKAWHSLVSTLPYMTRGRNASSVAKMKAEQLVEEYKQMTESLKAETKPDG